MRRYGHQLLSNGKILVFGSTDCGTVIGVSHGVAAKGPVSSLANFAICLPLTFDGTRHVCEQKPPQPYSQVKRATSSPLGVTICTSGAAGRLPSASVIFG